MRRSRVLVIDRLVTSSWHCLYGVSICLLREVQASNVLRYITLSHISRLISS